MSERSYRLVNQDGDSRPGRGTAPCGPGVLHLYCSPEVAVLGNPIHDAIERPRCLCVESESVQTDGFKRSTSGACTVIGEVELPVLSINELVAWAIVLAPHASTRSWAIQWLNGCDRSSAAARAAAARAAEARAAEAAEAAAWAAVAWAAEAAAWAAEAAWAVQGAQVATAAQAEARLMPAFARAQAILVGEYPVELYDAPMEKEKHDE